MSQSYKNHSRYIPLHHFIVPSLLLVVTYAAILHVIKASTHGEEIQSPLVFLAAVIAIWIIWFYARLFAVRAQDRIIMLEEKLRHQQLTGKPLNSLLRHSQVIALRFASDEEFPALAEKAAAENLTSKQIKQQIQKWRADIYRV